MKPLALQLYTVRDIMQNDVVGTVKRVGEIGYAGVECSGLPGMSLEDAAALFREIGLRVSSIHSGLPNESNADEIAAQCRILGCSDTVVGFGPDQMATLDLTKQCAADFQLAAEVMQPRGIRVSFHNHWWEFSQTFEGRTAYEIMLAEAPDVCSELDVYWCQYGGADPVAVIEKHKARIPLLHVKDGPLTGGDHPAPHTAVGKGTLDIPAIIGATDPAVCDWLIVELDHCLDDMLTASAESYEYLIGKGLARGRE